MSVINSLTDKEKSLLSVYRDKWLAIGLSTDPANRKEAEKGIDLMYSIASLDKPKKIWCLSPLSAALSRAIITKIKRDSVRDSVWDSVRDSVGDSVWDSVWASVGASVWDSVGASVGDSVWDSVRASVRASVRDSVWDSVRDSVWASVGDSVRDSVWDSVRDSVYGQHDSYWLGFYDYFNNILKLEKQTEKLKGLWIYSKNAGWAIPHKNICWLSERHNICNLKDGSIHCDGGPAIQYPDGFTIWALNGVMVPKYLAETSESDLEIEFFKKEKNVEVRAQFVKKFGIERMKSFGKVVSSFSDYELIDMSNIFQSKKYAPYLKMLNPSTGTIHMEGIHPDCKTVEQALNWRNGIEGEPIVLT